MVTIEKIGEIISKEDSLGFIFMTNKINEIIDWINKSDDTYKEKAIKKIDLQMKLLRENLHSRCGTSYPHKTDKEGWEMYGKLQGLAWVRVMILKE